MGRLKKNKKKDRRFKFKNLMKIFAGVDEVGRGSLIGPVYAAAVILNKTINKKLLKDSKSLSKIKREKLFIYIKKRGAPNGTPLILLVTSIVRIRSRYRGGSGLQRFCNTGFHPEHRGRCSVRMGWLPFHIES